MIGSFDTLSMLRSGQIALFFLAIVAASSAVAFTAVCEPSDSFVVSLDKKTIKAPVEPSSELLRGFIKGLKAALMPSRVIVSYDSSRERGQIIFEGVMREEGKVTYVAREPDGRSISVFYIPEDGGVELISMSSAEGQWVTYFTRVVYPDLDVSKFTCKIDG